MKKKKIVAVVAATLVASALGLTACGGGVSAKNNTSVAYGAVYNQYAGRVSVTVDADKKIQDVRFDEFLGVQDIGIKANEVANTIDEDDRIDGVVTNFRNSTLNTATYAKYIKIGDQVFTLVKLVDSSGENNHALYGYRNTTWADGTEYEIPTRGNLNATTIDEVSHTAQSLPTGKKNAFSNPAFAEWYIKQMEAGNYSISKNAEGTESYDVAFTTYGDAKVNKKTWASKAINGYWSTGNGLGWKLNMANMRLALIGTDFSGYSIEDENGFIGDVNTGATLSGYHDYMGIAKTAYDKAVEIFA